MLCIRKVKAQTIWIQSLPKIVKNSETVWLTQVFLRKFLKKVVVYVSGKSSGWMCITRSWMRLTYSRSIANRKKGSHRLFPLKWHVAYEGTKGSWKGIREDNMELLPLCQLSPASMELISSHSYLPYWKPFFLFHLMNCSGERINGNVFVVWWMRNGALPSSPTFQSKR